MRIVSGAIAAGLAAAVVHGSSPAFADERADGAGLDHLLLYSGFDLWRAGGSAYGGLLWSPRGLAREGFTLKLLLATARYRYRAGTAEILGRQMLTSVMGGWRFRLGKAELTAFGGPDLQSHRLMPDDPGNRARGGRVGLRLGGDLWYEPSTLLMVAASASASTIGPSYWLRGALGWRLFDRVWVGPELLALGDWRYQQFRVGLHLTGLRTAALEWYAALGLARDSDHRDGCYTQIGLITRRR